MQATTRQQHRGARLEVFHRGGGWSARTPSSAIRSNDGGLDYVELWRLTIARVHPAWRLSAWSCLSGLIWLIPRTYLFAKLHTLNLGCVLACCPDSYFAGRLIPQRSVVVTNGGDLCEMFHSFPALPRHGIYEVLYIIRHFAETCQLLAFGARYMVSVLRRCKDGGTEGNSRDTCCKDATDRTGVLAFFKA